MKPIIIAFLTFFTVLANAQELSPQAATALLNKIQADQEGRRIYNEYISEAKNLCGGESYSYFAKGGELFRDGYLMFINCAAKPDMAFQAFTISMVIPFMPNSEEPDAGAADYRVDGLSY